MDTCCTTIVVPTGPTGNTGTQAPLFVSNTVFVDETYGSNSTGAVERRDLPYLTRPVALAAAEAMLPAPSATRRIMIVVDNIVSTTPLELSNFIDYDLQGGSIVVAAGSSAAIDDNNDACNSIVYNANLIKKTGGTNVFGLRTQNAATNLTIYAKEITSTGNCGASIEGGLVDLGSGTRITTTSSNENAIEKSGGTLILNSCTLIATGTGSSLFSTTAQSVKCYGSVQANLNKNVNITLQGGAFVVSSNIV